MRRRAAHGGDRGPAHARGEPCRPRLGRPLRLAHRGGAARPARHSTRSTRRRLRRTTMPKVPPMEAVTRVLEDEGVEYIWGIPGAAILPLYQALSRSHRIKHLSVRHEEGGTH